MMSVLKAITSAMLALSLIFASSASASNDPVKADPNTGANFNRYTYSNNNPYRFIDPDGRMSKDLTSPCNTGGCGFGGSDGRDNPGRRIRDYDSELGVSNSGGPRVWLNPTGGQVRGCDGYGCGHNGASRDGGRREHLGADYNVAAGDEVSAPTNGKIERLSNPYVGDARYTGVQLNTSAGHVVKMWYLAPNKGIVGSEVRTGQRLGISQDLSIRYRGNMTNHTHVRILDSQGANINPEDLIP